MSGSCLRVTLTVAFVWKLSQQKEQTVVRIVKGTRYYPIFLETETGLVRVCIMGLFEWTLYRLVHRHVQIEKTIMDVLLVPLIFVELLKGNR